MKTYLILQDPGHNRVYFEQSKKMALAELTLACGYFKQECKDIEIVKLADIRYLSFSCSSAISNTELLILSQLSFSFALFQKETTGSEVSLIPIQKNHIPNVDSKISSVLKYPGKTNELFTRMMINVARLSGPYYFDKDVRLFDPIAGRGTTLFEGMIFGFNVTGMEIQSKSVHETTVFLKKFFEKERYKHRVVKNKITGKTKGKAALNCEFVYAKDKQDFKNEASLKTVKIVEANSSSANHYFKQNTFHFIVGDLPYGIAHNNFSKSKENSLMRNPYEFLQESLPHWLAVLKKNGTLVLAWNAFVYPKEKMDELLSMHGFKVLNDSPYSDFEHMVDSSIKRDIIVAQKV